jgi:hypothetical protein
MLMKRSLGVLIQESQGCSARLTVVAARAVRTVRLVLLAGLFASSALTAGQWIARADVPERTSDVRISLTALSPAIVQAPSRPVAKLLNDRREQQRTYPRPWALFAPLLPLAALLRLGLLRLTGRWRARFMMTGRAVASRAPPALTFA